MAQFLPGPLISSIAGSIGGQTFQRGASGLQVRTKPLPRNPQTGYTQPTRQYAQWLSREWGNLSHADQDAWTAFALGTTWYDRFGNVIVGKGYWAYLRCNLNWKLCNEAYQNAPTPVTPIAPIVGLTADLSISGYFNVKWTVTDPTPANETWLVYASPVWSAGRAKAFGLTRFITKFRGGSSSPVDIFADWSARVHSTMAVDKVVFLKIVQVDINSGWAAAPSTALITII